MSSKLASLFARLRAVLPPLPRAWVELRCARRLDRLAARLKRMQARIARMQAHLTDAAAPNGPVSDADGALRRMLAGLRAELARMRCGLALWHVRECGGRSGARLAAAQRHEAELEARAE